MPLETSTAPTRGYLQYDGDMDDEGDRAPSPSKLLRTLSSSTSNNAMNRSWRDHRNALESELERVEKELDETKILLDAERGKVEDFCAEVVDVTFITGVTEVFLGAA